MPYIKNQTKLCIFRIFSEGGGKEESQNMQIVMKTHPVYRKRNVAQKIAWVDGYELNYKYVLFVELGHT